MSDSAMTVSELVARADERTAAGQHEQAIQDFARAIGQLADTASSWQPADRILATETLTRMHQAAELSGEIAPLVTSALQVFEPIGPTSPIIREIVTLAVDDDQESPEAIELYLQYIESGGRLPRTYQERLIRVLARTLRVRSRSSVEDIAPLVPHLERLHRCAPSLDFPTLYLGRYHHLAGSHDEAERYLSSLRGPLARAPKTLNMRALGAELQEDVERARSLYRESLEADPEQPEIHFRLGRLALQEGLEAIGQGAILAGSSAASTPSNLAS